MPTTPRRVIVAPRPPRAHGRRPSGSQSLERGLDILEMIEAEGSELGVRELARRAELSPTIVQRLISSLALRGYVEKNLETARYRLGHRSLSLGASSERAFDHAGTARRELETLSRDHALNGFVSVLRAGRAIYVLAVQADVCAVRTVEGLGTANALNPLQQAMARHHALQCGFCTPGMLMTITEFVDKRAGLPPPTEAEVREALTGNICRCSGYQGIVDAVLSLYEVNK